MEVGRFSIYFKQRYKDAEIQQIVQNLNSKLFLLLVTK